MGNLPLQDALGRLMCSQSKPGRQVLKQRCFAVAGIAAEDDKPDASLADVPHQRFL